MKKLFAVLLACALLVVALPTSADAYVTKRDSAKGWWGDDTILYSYDSSINNAQYATYVYDWEEAVDSWNTEQVDPPDDTRTIPIFYQSANSNGRLSLGVCYLSYDDVYGTSRYNWYSGDNAHVLRGAYAYINLTPDDIDDEHVAQSAAAHELGHISGLEHENAIHNSLMFTRRNRSDVYSPDSDSLLGVISFYSDFDFDTWEVN